VRVIGSYYTVEKLRDVRLNIENKLSRRWRERALLRS
jgi:hypothetical protein